MNLLENPNMMLNSFGQERMFKKAFILNSDQYFVDSQINHLLDPNRFKRQPIHIFDSNFTLKNLKDIRILQCPFVGGFIHLTENNFNHLLDQEDFDKFLKNNQTSIVRFVIYPEEVTPEDRLTYEQVELCILNLEQHHNLEKLVKKHFWSQIDYPLEKCIFKAQLTPRHKLFEDLSTSDDDGYSLQDEKSTLLEERAQRVENLRKDNRGEGDLLIEGSHLFWRQFFWNKQSRNKNPGSQVQNLKSNNFKNTQEFSQTVDQMSDNELYRLLDSEQTPDSNDLSLSNSSTMSKDLDFHQEIEDIFFGLDLLEDRVWNSMPQKLIMSLRVSDVRPQKEEITPAFSSLETILVNFKKFENFANFFQKLYEPVHITEEHSATNVWNYLVLDKRYPRKFIDPTQKVKIEAFQKRMKSSLIGSKQL